MEVLYYCKTCGNPVFVRYGSGTFCSISCANKNRDVKYYETKEMQNEDGKNLCLNCGKILKKHGKFCNASCQFTYQQKMFEQDWLSGNLEVKVSPWCNTAVRIRKYLINKYDNKCSRCGWGETNPYTGRVPLEVEHIDGNPDNNSPDNVTLLCPNCHSLTKSYRGANKGHGRKKTWMPRM